MITRYIAVMRMMDIREKILTTLDRKPGDMFSVSQIARAIGSTPKATNATLSRLFKAGLIARPQKGGYSSLRVSSAKATPSVPAEPRKKAKLAKVAEPVAVATSPLTVITIELLVEGEQSKVDVGRILGKIREDKTVLDTRVKKVTEADQSKLQIRFALSDED